MKNLLHIPHLSYSDFDGVVPRSQLQQVATNNERESSISSNESDKSDEEQDEIEANSDEEGNNSEEQKMIRYFELMDKSTFSSDKEEAMSIILDQLYHGDAETNKTLPVNLFGQSKSKIRKCIIQFLSHRIPETKRQKRLGDSVLKKWFLSLNRTRKYMFNSKDSLVEIGATLFGQRLDTRSSIDTLIKELLIRERRQQEFGATDHQQQTRRTRGRHTTTTTPTSAPTNTPTPVPTVNSNSITQEIIQKLLEKSFMKHLKGAAREHCQMGHKLELPIGNSWMNDVNIKSLFQGYKILSLHKVGLVSKKNEPWAKDSIDFVASVMKTDNSDLELWGVEIKSRQTNLTVSKERENMRKLHRKKYEEIGADKVEKYVLSSDERYQILHHAYVYGFDKVALIIGDKSGKVISGTIIEFPQELRDAYGRVIKEIKDIALLWAYGSTSQVKIPNNVLQISENVSTINGKEALYGALKLWKVMFDDPSILPMPTLKRIIPTTHAQWNATKGGSDTITKIVDDCVLHPPKNYTNFESVAVGRCISNTLATILKLYQVTSSEEELNYPSMQHFRNAASHRITYKKMLRMTYKIFTSEAKRLEQNNGKDTSQEVTNSRNQQQGQCRIRFRQHQGLASAQEMDYAKPKTFYTPQKSQKKQVETGQLKVDQTVLDRRNTCTGCPVEVFCQEVGANKTDPRRRCYICKDKTKWRCVKCRFYFCMTTKTTKN